MKGNISDVFAIMAFLFGGMFVLIFAFPIANAFLTQLSDQNTIATQVKNQWISTVEIFDKALPVIYIILLLISLGAAANISAHPSFFFFFLFVNIFMVLGYYVFAQIWDEAFNADTSQDLRNTITWTPLFMQYIPMINIGIMLFVAFVQYSKGVVS